VKIKVKSGLLQKETHHLLLILILLSNLILVSACVTDGKEVNNSHTDFEVDPIFREFYSHLGGIDRIGLAITGVSIKGSKTIQYTETCKLVYDANALPTQHFKLAPLGVEMELREPSVPPPNKPGYRYYEGHTIHPEFLPIYEEMGVKIVGRPLTEARFNLVKKRYEQFFENIGFYRVEGDSQILLMPYGLWACGDDCSPGMRQANAIIDSYHPIDPTFKKFVEEHGADFTGFAITDAYLTKEGDWQQIFENIVLVSSTVNYPEGAHLVPLPDKLNLIVEPPQPYSGNPASFFFTIKENEGYEIPIYFWDYITEHGGIELFGKPIQHITSMNHEIIRQCFTELCLLFDPFAIEGVEIRPEPLGYSYEYLYHHNISNPTSTPEQVMPFVTPTPAQETELQKPEGREIVLQVWEKYPILATNQIQEIGVLVVDWTEPLPNIMPELVVELPDQAPYSVIMPPTRKDGKSLLLLPPINAPNSSIIDYKVCIRIEGADKFCVRKSFVIWNNP